MVFLGKFRILENFVSVCDYDFILSEIDDSIKKQKKFLICPIASQALVLAYNNRDIRRALNSFDHLLPCSEWVKRSINFLYGTNLGKRIYGPDLMLKVCRLAENSKYNVFFYGVTKETLNKLVQKLRKQLPKISIVGYIPSKFAPLDNEERDKLGELIERRGTHILFIGLGEPFQEMFLYELFKKYRFSKPLTVLTVGTAFDFIAGVKPQAPKWMQNTGLEWFFRLLTEPRRLWFRYLILGPMFILLVVLQKIKLLLNFSNHKPLKKEVWG